MSQPKRLHEAPINHTVAYEMVDADALGRFSDSLADKLPSRRFGSTLRTKENSPNLNARLANIVNNCHATA